MKIAIPHKCLVRIWDTEKLQFDNFMEMLTMKEAIELSNKLNEKIYYTMYNKE